jgi:hypothetical protein
MKPLEERALDQLVLGNMNADQEWLVQNSPTSYSYWLNTLETRIESTRNPDRSVTLRAQTIIATGVDNVEMAERVCRVLNFNSLSWAFAYDYDDKSIKALSSVNIYVHEIDEPYPGVLEPESFQNAWLILLCHSIWGQATLGGELADTAAKLTGGVAAHSNPMHQDAPREVPDVFCLLPDVLHQRPEWVQDYFPFMRWPDLDESAAVLKQSIEEEFETGFTAKPWRDVTDDSPRLDVVFKGETIADWSITRLGEKRYGICWDSRICMHNAAPEGYRISELQNIANLQMFRDKSASLLGCWAMDDEDAPTFISMFPSAFLRTLEDSAASTALLNYNPVFFARLALKSRGAIDCLQALPAKPNSKGAAAEEEEEDLLEILVAITETLSAPGRAALTDTDGNPGSATSDPAILRNEWVIPFFTIGIFNPMGPTIISLEAFPTENQNEYSFVSTQRHPYYPSYIPLAKVTGGSPEYLEVLESSVEREFVWLPTYLDFNRCPREDLPRLEALVKKRLLAIAIDQKIDVAKHTQRLRDINDDAWSRVDHSLPLIEETDTPATKREIDKYFDLITSDENLALFWNAIPDAWDGSLNYSLSNGILGQTNVGPLLWTYNREIGVIR